MNPIKNAYRMKLTRKNDRAQLILMADTFEDALEQFHDSMGFDWLEWEIESLSKDEYFEEETYI